MVGDVVGQYRLLRKIGEGGMGTVYLGEHVLIGRQAAIKVLLRDMSHRQDLVARFFNEARAASAVKHPGIVEIYDFGYHTDGSAYIVMEFLEGESLASRLAALGRLPTARAAALCRQIVGALGAAHAKGIIHRDLKPDNIFIVRDPDTADGERTKILDFGIAKLAAADQQRLSATRTGTVMGTPAYMSPEQSKGAGNVDARADLYALGCILFEMLCGRPPFVAEGGGEILAQHIFAPAPLPSSIVPIRPELEQLILRALAKDPAHRFQSADELNAALQFVATSGSLPHLGALPLPPQTRYVVAATPAQTTLGAAQVTTSTSPASRRRAWLSSAIALLLIGGGAGVIAIQRGGDAGERSAKPVEPNAAAPGARPSTVAAAAAQAPSSTAQAENRGPVSTPAAPLGRHDVPDSPPPLPLVNAPAVDRATILPAVKVAPGRTDGSPHDELNSVDSECLKLQTAYEWEALIGCALRLDKLGAKNKAQKYLVIGHDEQENKVTAAQAKSLIDKGYLKDALAIIAKIRPTSMYYKSAQDALTKAEDEAIREGIQAAEAYSARGDCGGLRKYKQQFSLRTQRVISAIAEIGCIATQVVDRNDLPASAGPSPPKVDEKKPVTPTTPNTPTPRTKTECEGIDIEAIIDQSAEQYMRGSPAAALKLMIQALNCQQNVTMLRLAAMYACAAGDLKSAKLLLPKVPPQFRPAVVQRCEQENLHLRGS